MGNFDRTRWFSSALKMDITRWLALFLAVITLGTPAASSEPRVVCYYTNWSVYRPGTARFNPQNINPYLCTHLIYAFGGFTKDNTLKPFDKYQDIEKGGYAKFTGLKTYNKQLKTLLAIGGWNEGSTRFSPMVGTRDRRKEFVRNVIKFLRQNRFDGLDLDWEYPAFRDGGKPKDRENYAKLVKELREEFEKEAEKTGKPRLLLTMAVPAGIEYIQKGYDVKTLNRYLDWMNLLAYDYHSAFEPAVNHHAPLYPLEEPNEYSVDNELNIDYTIKFYLEAGADRDKLVMGIPTYGRSYTLFNADAVDIGSPADGPGEQGDATREKGYLAYYEICEALKPKVKKRQISSDEDSEEYSDEEEEEEDQPWTVMHPNPEAMGPVAYKGNQWVGYDDVDIVKKKAEYVAKNGLGGIMFWSIDNDDFRGTCHGKPYPLIEAAKEAYFAKIGSGDSTFTEKTSTARPSNNRRKNRPKPRITTTTTTTTTPKSSTKSNKRNNALTSTTPAWNIATPEPPTTPDPGSDFKCTDEGFFPHPRDCKKYFWCLDSGPSDLGIVAHQFTCPSGLHFNKAADSCDFARNVHCKQSTPTTKAPTTKTTKPSTTSTTVTTTTSTTTRRPIRLSTKSSSLFRTTSTTTPAPESEEDEEYEDDVPEDSDSVDAEDPKVIKELIDLIKKVGGIEQLEKQLLGDTSASTSGGSTTTPSSFNKILYQKVLERTRGKNKYTGKNNSIVDSLSTSRRGPQNAGIEPSSDGDKLLRKDRPQYTTINRQRPSTSTTPQSESEELPEEPEVEERPVFKSRAKISEGSVATTAKPLQYVNIRRGKPTPATSDEADDSASRNALFERQEPYASVTGSSNSLDILSVRKENTPEYVTIRRQRPSTEETTTAQYQEDADEEVELQETALEREISSQPQYTSIVRSRSTTSSPVYEQSSDTTFQTRSSVFPIDGPSSPEPTTVLSVQISSLLNSPISSETDASVDIPVPTTEIVEPSTTTRRPITTTTTTTASSASLPPRRTVIRRRGSTTTTLSTTAAPSSTTQVSSRNYTFISRRRPWPRQNEISSDSNEAIELPRKIRSTTPDSREVEGTKPEKSSRRFRGRFQSTQSPLSDEDSVPAAASFARGQLRPIVTPDELISLTPIDVEPQFVPRERLNTRSERRFRGRSSTSTTVADTIADNEVSAATLDTRRPTIVPRGRNRFALSTTTEAPIPLSSTTSSVNVRRPTFARFTPRPFLRSTSTTSVLEDSDPTASEVTQPSIVSRRAQNRLNFGRARLSSTTATPVIIARKLPFPSRTTTTTTQQPVVNNDDYEDEPENKVDDITLSESTIEEKEHDDVTEPLQETPRRRVVIKKLRAPTTAGTETIATEAVPIDDTGKKRIRVIRRRPSSTTVASELVTTPEIPTAPQRIRKVIRKKIKHIEDEPEITAKSIGSLNVAQNSSSELINYGEKTRMSTSTTTTESATEPITEIFEPIKEEIKHDLITQEENRNPKAEKANEFATNSKNDEKADNDNTAEDAEVTTVTSTSVLVDVQSRIQDSEIKSETEEVPTTDTNLNNENDNDKEPDSPSPWSETSNPQNENVTERESEPNVVVESNGNGIDLSEIKELETLAPNLESEQEITTISSTLSTSPSTKIRLPFRSRKKLFTSTTESSIPSSSRTFSRKFNPGAYTSPATVARAQFRPSVTRRPFSSNIFTRRPFTTARTTQRAEEEEEEEYNDEELLEEEPEPEDSLVLVPANQLFTRKPDSIEENDEGGSEEILDEEDDRFENEDDSEKKNQNRYTTKKPAFKPRVVNSNTFRTSTSTTQLPRRFGSQNRSSIITRFSANKPISDAKIRVQNVPVGYNSPLNALRPGTSLSNRAQNTTQERQNEAKTTTISSVSDTETIATTSDDDYLSMTLPTQSDTNDLTTIDVQNMSTGNTVESETVTEEMEIDNSTDDYLVYTEGTTNYPITQYNSAATQTEFDVKTTIVQNPTTVSNTEVVTEVDITTTTVIPTVSPIVKTQFDKLFSISRVVEVSSKQDKHRVNKNNETTHIEEGQVMIEKKPMVDKIGEVSRFSLIKIVEDEIPIYLTKYGHVYPVEHPPDNHIRIDEARNARALVESFPDPSKENLVASESVNEAYRHVKRVSDYKTDEKKDHVEHVPSDDFLSFINEEKNDEKSDSDLLFDQWQFIPAAYENEKERANSQGFQIVTPRSMINNPSTLPLEGLFKTEVPIMARKVSDGQRLPYLVYSASVPNQKEDDNIVKLDVLKPETGRSIVTFAKGQEFNGASITTRIDDTTVKYPISVSMLSQDTGNNATSSSTTVKPTDSTTITTTVTTQKSTSPIIELLSTTQPTTQPTTVSTTDIPSTTEQVTEEITTVKVSPLGAKRTKFAFPRRPVIKSSNLTRLVPTPRTAKKINVTTVSNTSQKLNKTSFSPNKSRFTANRLQNVPVDVRKKGSAPKVTKSYTTESPKTTTEKKVFVKPFRPSFRPAFIPRRTTTIPTTISDT